jgi:predicted NAD/FAD-dependent oxidoreductase
MECIEEREQGHTRTQLKSMGVDHHHHAKTQVNTHKNTGKIKLQKAQVVISIGTENLWDLKAVNREEEDRQIKKTICAVTMSPTYATTALPQRISPLVQCSSSTICKIS